MENGRSKRLSIPSQSFVICAKKKNRIYKFDWKRNRRNFGRIKAQFGLVVSFQLPETMKHNAWNIISIREILPFLT